MDTAKTKFDSFMEIDKQNNCFYQSNIHPFKEIKEKTMSTVNRIYSTIRFIEKHNVSYLSVSDYGHTCTS